MSRIVARFFIFLLCFIVVHCYHEKAIHRRQSKSNSELVENYEFVSCGDRMFSQSYKKHNLALRCKPREAVVQIHSGENDVEMVPSHVVVKRCYESGCQGMKSCIPTRTGNVTVPVQVRNHIYNTSKCTWLTVVEHLECKCRCGKSKEYCQSLGKVYNHNACVCECTNLHEKSACDRQENMIWDDENCKCMCKTTYRECSTGSTWAPQHCKCVPYLH